MIKLVSVHRLEIHTSRSIPQGLIWRNILHLCLPSTKVLDICRERTRTLSRTVPAASVSA